MNRKMEKLPLRIMPRHFAAIRTGTGTITRMYLLMIILSAALIMQAGAFTLPALASSTQESLSGAESSTEEISAGKEGMAQKGLSETEALSRTEDQAADRGGRKIVLRVCNWEEYIDLGGWEEDEVIDLDSGDIIGENPLVKDFEDWYLETYGTPVHVEYSTFGTNEDLYNMLNLGDVYDLVCPSEYMFMKLLQEDQLVPLSDAFFDEEDGNNYYIRGISPYIRSVFDSHEINGQPWSRYAAGYMWGITGIVYNPEKMTHEQASTWKVLADPAFARQVTIKDNVRDSYFAAVGALKSDLLTDPAFPGLPDYEKRLEEEMNDVSPETIAEAEDYLQKVRKNAYSFETDSGKADMITGKVVANLQWSGDGVYTMDQADEDGFTLCFAVPKESTNIYFDGWVMLKRGVEGDPARQHAAEAFINFCSRPDNVIRNMYYIGYTSVISGGEDERIFEYVEWNYGAEADGGDAASAKAANGLIDYPLGYFFSGDPDDGDYILTVPEESVRRQLGSQYPSQESISRSSIMVCFDPETSEAINRMWIHVRCFDIRDVPPWVWVLVAAAAGTGMILFIRFKTRGKRRA